MIKTQLDTINFKIIVTSLYISVGLNVYNIISIVFKIYSSLKASELLFDVGLIGITLFGLLLYRIQMVEIDTFRKIITVKRFITKKITEYSFTDVDGFYDVAMYHYKQSRDGHTKAIAFTKNKKIIILIDAEYCSNYEEIRESLNNVNGLNYLGVDKNWVKNNF